MKSTSVFAKTAKVLIIVLSSGILFFVSLYWIFTCTLLNSAFYAEIADTQKAASSFDAISEILSADGIFALSGEAIRDNVLSLVEGITRYITQNDMSLSDISFEKANTEALRSVVLSASPDIEREIPDISRIHPYVLTYFMPGSEKIFLLLRIIQTAYALFRSVYPAISVVGLLLLLMTAKPAENTGTAMIAAGSAAAVAGIFTSIFGSSLIISLLSGILSDSADLLKPLVHATALAFLARCIMASAILFCAAAVFRVRLFGAAINTHGRKWAFLFVITAGVFLIIYRKEVFTDVMHTMKSQPITFEADMLDQAEGTVHSLVIKIREKGTEQPLPGIKLILARLGSGDDPFLMTVYSDSNGDARFILPKGSYFIYADKSTVPPSYTPFDPITVTVDKPDSSWYMLHMTWNGKQDFSEARNEEFFELRGLPIP